MLQSLLKSVLHNVFVVVVGFAFALLGTGVDKVFGFPRFHSAATLVVGVTLLTAGFLLRVWAAYHFYNYRFRTVPLLQKSPISWRKCFHLLGHFIDSWHAGRSDAHRPAPPTRQFHD